MAELTLSNARQLKDIPALRQLFSLLVIAGAVAIGFSVHTWSQKPDYAPVFTQLGDKDASEIANALRAADIPFQVELGSGAVTVPAAQVHEARLKLAAQGLPRSTTQGFELIQQEQGFGTSQFIESARYQHALETELARTIGSLQPVASARVHLAVPKPSAFTRAGEAAASASVLLELRAGRVLEKDQVASIVHLVASSVPQLQPSAVTVIDQSGRLLTRDGADAGMGQTTEQFEYARRVEAEYVRRIEQLLTPMTGPGRVSAQVSAVLDFSVVEEARETYNPNPQAVRSEQSSENTSRTANVAQGVPGATSNQPPAPAVTTPVNGAPAVAATDNITEQSRNSTRNFEMDKTLSHKRQGPGEIKRLSVAVLVDNLPRKDAKGAVTLTALTPEQLQQVEALVQQAVGFDAARGDSVSVQNAAFMAEEAPTAPPALPLWQQPEVRDIARTVLGVITVLFLVLVIVRPLLRNLMQASVQPQTPQALINEHGTLAVGHQDAGHHPGLPAEDRLSLTASGAPETPAVPEYEQKLQAARAAVTQDPKRVAQVVKNWVAAEST